MKKHSSHNLRQIAAGCGFLLVFLGITLLLFTYRREEKLFSRLTSNLFVEEMTANTLNMHYTIAAPSNFGIYDYQAVLPLYSAENRLSNQAKTENTLSALTSLQETKLSDSDEYTRRLLVRSLNNSLALSRYTYYEEPLSPASGMQSQLPILLAEYTFRSKRDVLDYLSLLDQTDEYFESLLVFEQEKSDAGLFMPATSLSRVRTQCDRIMTRDDLAEGTHFLQTTFEERLLPLCEAGVISAEELPKYVAQNNRLLSTVMLPAYEKLSDGLLVLTDEKLPLSGLASKPDGAAYYEQLLIAETGSYRPISQIKQLLTARFDGECDAIRTLINAHPEIKESKTDSVFPYQKPAQMLADLQQRMAQDFPPYASAESMPSVTVKSISPSLQDYCAPAFYLTPPLDNTTENVIYINEKNSPEGLELYTTLAHEGYPGHLYQSVYNNRYMAAQGGNKVRQILWYGGYLEGWALYVEFLSFDYASELMKEQGNDEAAALIQLEKHNRSLQLCLYSLLDIMIHYENASYSDTAQLLQSLGIEDKASIAAIYQYIVEEPCNYLKYYLGYLEILQLQKDARTLWADNYTDYAFHSFFLDCGPSDFTTLRECLQDSPLPEKEPAASKISAFSKEFMFSKSP